jgi:FkbM family methyltransferase
MLKSLLRRHLKSADKQAEDRRTEVDAVPFWDLGNYCGIVRAHNGSLICIDTRDAPVCANIRRLGSWERHIESIYRRLLRSDSIVVDVGSNVGYHAAAFASIARSVIAIEANPWTASLLRCTIALNHLRNVTLIERAIMDRPQSVEIFAADTELGGGAVARPSWYDDPTWSNHRRYRVDAVTLDSVTKGVTAVDLIHLDIEGCELPALLGATELLDRSPNVAIIMEWGAEWAPAYGDVEIGLDALTQRGFKFWRIESDAGLTPQTREQMLERQFMCDILASRAQRF